MYMSTLVTKVTICIAGILPCFCFTQVILATMSEVFRAMFMGGLKEASQSEIVLQDEVDLSAEGFEVSSI